MYFVQGHTLIIAEAGVNHNGSLEQARKLVDAAAAAGADYVKFQTFKADKMIAASAKKAAYQIENTGQDDTAESQLEMVRKLELTEAHHQELQAYCSQQGIGFLSTAFDTESLALLEKLELPLYKIPSGEITNFPLLQAFAQTGRPLVLSTGMAKLGEIEAALEVLTLNGADPELLTVLHCSTQYPTPVDQVNLRAMHTIGEAFGVSVGYSDHTLGTTIPIAAVAMGATMIEKHFTLDRNLPGPDHKASLEPAELAAMVTAIRDVERARGDGIKRPMPCEMDNLAVARKSIHLARALPKDHRLSPEDLLMKRPGDGISPAQLSTVVGMRLQKALPQDYQLNWNDLCG